MNRKKNEADKGLRIFIILISLIFVICIITLVVTSKSKDKSDSWNGIQAEETTQISDGAFQIEEPNKNSSRNSKTEKMDSVEVAKKACPSVIAVLSYSKGNPYSEGAGIVMKVDKASNITYFITCYHIIDGADLSIKIQNSAGTRYDAEIVGKDKNTDLAVLKVASSDFLPAEFGDSGKLQVGESVYAIGNPGGTVFYGSFTSGVVSAINRPGVATTSLYSLKCIQHDAAISPGNSGGALINSFGQVVGINSSKIAEEQYEGMGFAIPITDAKPIIDQIMSFGYVKNRSKIGIAYVEASKERTYADVASKNKLPAGSIVVMEVDTSGSLAGIDIKKGDIITGVNGNKMENVSTLTNLIVSSPPGTKINLSIFRLSDRSGSYHDITVTLVEDKG